MNLKEVKHEKCTRKSFSKIGDFVEMPNLIQVQKDSYNWFIEEGLGEVLRDISPIVDYSGNLVLEFLDYHMEEKTKYTMEEAKERDHRKIGKDLEIFMSDDLVGRGLPMFLWSRESNCKPISSFSILLLCTRLRQNRKENIHIYCYAYKRCMVRI